MGCIYTYKGKEYSREEIVHLLASNNIDELNSNFNLDLENASKVVDDNGEPLVVYHGTPNDGINEFNIENVSDITNEPAYGFYTTEDKNYGKYYAKEGGVVYDLFLNIRNPFNLGHRDSDKGLPTTNNLRLITKSKLDKYNSDGFDGVIFKDKSDTLYEIVSFSPNQIKSATSNAGTYSNKTGRIDLQIIGEQGAKNLDKFEEGTIRLDNLGVAREMEIQKKSTKEIRLATGWERGADGKWRYEIQDGDFTEEFYNLRKKEKEILDSKGNYGVTDARLGDLFDIGDELRKAHPYIEELKLEIKINPESKSSGQLSGRKEGDGNYYPNKVFTEGKDIEAVRSIVLHEIQHAIQRYEGFAKGGNMEIASKLDAETIREISQVEKILKDAIGFKEKNEWLTEGKSISDLIDDEIGFYPDKIIKWAKRIADAGESEINLFLNETPFRQYQKLAGEVESRNVQNRDNMSMEERRQVLLSETEDVAREDQIVVFDAMGLIDFKQNIDINEDVKSNSETPSQTYAQLTNHPFLTEDQALEIYKDIYSDDMEYWKDNENNCK